VHMARCIRLRSATAPSAVYRGPALSQHPCYPASGAACCAGYNGHASAQGLGHALLPSSGRRFAVQLPILVSAGAEPQRSMETDEAAAMRPPHPTAVLHQPSLSEGGRQARRSCCAPHPLRNHSRELFRFLWERLVPTSREYAPCGRGQSGFHTVPERIRNPLGDATDCLEVVTGLAPRS
jgi:hypothetical protein